MYEYSDVYDECENGVPDEGPVILSRKRFIGITKQHGHLTSQLWLNY